MSPLSLKRYVSAWELPHLLLFFPSSPFFSLKFFLSKMFFYEAHINCELHTPQTVTLGTGLKGILMRLKKLRKTLKLAELFKITRNFGGTSKNTLLINWKLRKKVL